MQFLINSRGLGVALEPPKRSFAKKPLGSMVLRPAPGSRVNLIPAHTQGAGVPIFGAPVKGNTCRTARDF